MNFIFAAAPLIAAAVPPPPDAEEAIVVVAVAVVEATVAVVTVVGEVGAGSKCKRFGATVVPKPSLPLLPLARLRVCKRLSSKGLSFAAVGTALEAAGAFVEMPVNNVAAADEFWLELVDDAVDKAAVDSPKLVDGIMYAFAVDAADVPNAVADIVAVVSVASVEVDVFA